MSLTSKQTSLVQSSFLEVAEEIALAAQAFYDRLFELDPSLRILFKDDMRVQGRKLMHALLIIVNGLENLDTLTPAIRSLGKRHLTYGVQRAHYETVGSALLWMLEYRLKDHFTPETRSAWQAAYQLIATIATKDESPPSFSADPHAGS